MNPGGEGTAWSLQRHRAEQRRAELGLPCSQKVKDRDTEEPLSQSMMRAGGGDCVRALRPQQELSHCRGGGCLPRGTGQPPASMFPNSSTGSSVSWSLRVSSSVKDKPVFEGHTGVQDLTDAQRPG